MGRGTEVKEPRERRCGDERCQWPITFCLTCQSISDEARSNKMQYHAIANTAAMAGMIYGGPVAGARKGMIKSAEEYYREEVNPYPGGVKDELVSDAREGLPSLNHNHIAGARKDDAGKSPIFRGALMYFPKALEAVARISDFGAKKYAWGGWRHVPDGFDRFSDALARHLLAEQYQVKDAETGHLEAAHVAWNALARLELLIHNQDELKKGTTDEIPPDVSDDDYPRGMWDHQP